jgi:flagellar basal-body rod protein FlgG
MPSISLSALLNIARSGLMAQQTNMDIVANNIANLNTVGFKNNRAEFNELLNDQVQELLTGSNRAPGQAAGTLLSANQRLFDQGQVQPSENEWDMAIAGEGFFQVQMPDGAIAYTRDGTFRLDGDGRLVTSRGNLLSPTFTLPPDAEETLVNPDGTVMVRRRGEAEPQSIGMITLARFANPAGLENIGDSLYRSTDASGAAQVNQPGTNGTGQLVGHALESSNVDLSKQIVDLISVQRAYTLMARAMETSDEMLGLVNQMRS